MVKHFTLSEFSAALLVASTVPSLAVDWCQFGHKHVGPADSITMTGAELLAFDAITPNLGGTTGTGRATTLALAYCAQTYGGPPIRSPAGASGESRIAPFGISAPANFQSPGYSMAQGMTFKCETCDYPFQLEIEDEIETDIAFPIDPDRMGMTWAVHDAPHAVTGAVTVACKTGAMDCNPYNGDTLCTADVPTLCINEMGLPKPPSLGEGRWSKWTGAIVATTAPGPATSTLSAANAQCVAEFGAGWRVAEFHDALSSRSAWSFSAYGNAGTMTDRFRVDIDDQAGGVCWDRSQ